MDCLVIKIPLQIQGSNISFLIQGKFISWCYHCVITRILDCEIIDPKMEPSSVADSP